MLATKVGYKTQSGISNLESRSTGSGGNKIGAIAQALGVSVDWLLNGPDQDKVPFIFGHSDQTTVLTTGDGRPPLFTAQHEIPLHRNEARPVERRNLVNLPERQSTADDWTLAAIAIMNALDPSQRPAMVAKMREFSQYLGPPREGQALQVAG